MQFAYLHTQSAHHNLIPNSFFSIEPQLIEPFLSILFSGFPKPGHPCATAH